MCGSGRQLQRRRTDEEDEDTAKHTSCVDFPHALEHETLEIGAAAAAEGNDQHDNAGRDGQEAVALVFGISVPPPSNDWKNRYIREHLRRNALDLMRSQYRLDQTAAAVQVARRLATPKPIRFEQFLSFDTFLDDVDRFGGVFAFAVMFNHSWERHQSLSRQDETWFTLDHFLVEYGRCNNFAITNALKRDRGRLYAPHSLHGIGAERARRYGWMDEASKVANRLSAAVRDPGFATFFDFDGLVIAIELAIDAIFDDESIEGFEVVPGGCRRLLAEHLASIHLVAGSRFE